MKEVSIDVLRDAAHRLLLDLPEQEYVTLEEDCRFLVQQMKALGDDEDLDSYSPMTFPFPCETTYLREDEANESLPVEEALANAGSKQDGQIKLPKVVR